jgi:hypothetical protein
VNIIKQKLTNEQEKKIKKALLLIEILTKNGRENGFRIIIQGGYAVDGFLGEITRHHNDVDIGIYGIGENAKEIVGKLFEKCGIGGGRITEDRGRKEYYYNFIYKLGDLNLDIYYIQAKTSPLGKEKFIIKSNGEVDEQEFKEPTYGKLGDITFEITDPLKEMKDKIYKREVRGDPKRPEHDQDLSNLKSTKIVKPKSLNQFRF